MTTEQRLAVLSEDAAACRRELAVLDEQVEFQREVAEEAGLRALVSETPLNDREADEAGRDLARLERVRAEVAGRLAHLSAEIDRLLDAAAG
jgi:hypothetical protein